jgi:hypothetical protein
VFVTVDRIKLKMPSSSSSSYDTPNESTRLLQDSFRLVRDTEEVGYYTEAQLKHQNEQLNDTNDHVSIIQY